MKTTLRFAGILLLSMGILFSVSAFKKKDTGDWKEKQLISPEALAAKIKAEDTNLLIINTGPVEDIKTAVNIGAVENAKNLEELKVYLKDVAKDKEIVIYCGCCPLSVCPNLKPAYAVLKDRQFKSYKVLKLTQDLQEDWIDKGYPVK